MPPRARAFAQIRSTWSRESAAMPASTPLPTVAGWPSYGFMMQSIGLSMEAAQPQPRSPNSIGRLTPISAGKASWNALARGRSLVPGVM